MTYSQLSLILMFVFCQTPYSDLAVDDLIPAQLPEPVMFLEKVISQTQIGPVQKK